LSKEAKNKTEGGGGEGPPSRLRSTEKKRCLYSGKRALKESDILGRRDRRLKSGLTTENVKRDEGATFKGMHSRKRLSLKCMIDVGKEEKVMGGGRDEWFKNCLGERGSGVEF